MRFKLDENLSPTLASGFISAGHEAHSALEQALGGAADPRILEVCQLEGRALVTLDLDFANIQRYPPGRYSGAPARYPGPRTGRYRIGERHRFDAAGSAERPVVDRRGGSRADT